MDRSLPRGRCPWRKHCELQVRRPNQKKSKRGGWGKRPRKGSHFRYSHEQTGLTAGTIANDDELATDLGHLDKEQVSIGGK